MLLIRYPDQNVLSPHSLSPFVGCKIIIIFINQALDILKPGKYVDITGSKSVNLENGAWEMIWRRNANAGALICGFHVPKEVTRNVGGASIPKGRLYVVSF